MRSKWASSSLLAFTLDQQIAKGSKANTEKSILYDVILNDNPEDFNDRPHTPMPSVKPPDPISLSNARSDNEYS